jgi:hypothetical protein
VKDARRVLVAALPDAAVAPQQVFEFGARHEREAIAQGGNTRRGTELVEDRQDGAALVAWRTNGRPTEGKRRSDVVAEVGAPGAEGAR